MKSKFLKLYNLVMESIISETSFSKNDWINPKHSYAQDVKNDILNGKPIKLGKRGESETIINIDENDRDNLLNSTTPFEFNEILKRNKNNVTWTKIFKGDYSKSVKANSTINSSITELIPCFLFMTHYNLENFNEETFDEILDNLNSDANVYSNVFVNSNDEEYAKSIFNDISFSDKKHQIMEGFSIFLCVKNLLSNKHVSEIKWTYRSKPYGIDSKDPSDFVIKLEENNEIIGVSCKAGIESSTEHKLNSYVYPVLNYFNDTERFKDAFIVKFKEVFLKYVLINAGVDNVNDVINDINSSNFKEKYKDIQSSSDINIDDIINIDNTNFLSFREKYKNVLFSLGTNSNEFRELQTFIINYFIKLFEDNLDLFSDFFKENCLGLSKDEIIDYFYVIKGFPNGLIGKNITPNITNMNDFKILRKNSVQSFLITSNESEVYQISLRTSKGLGCYELPNLRFSVQ